MTALNRRMSVPLLAALDVLEILLLVEVSLIVAKLASGQHPAGLATLIGYLIAMPLIPVAAAFWGRMERSRWGPAGHRRGRTRRGHTDGPAVPNLAGHPCLSPQHPLSRRRRARLGQDPAVCWSPPTDSSRCPPPHEPGCRSRRSSATLRSPTCCRPSPPWSTSSPWSPSC